MAHIILYLIALLSLSTAPNWAKLNHMPVEVLGFYRLLGATLLLSLFLIIKKKWPKYNWNASLGWAFASAFIFFLHLYTYKFASKNTLVSNTMILFASNPIWASIGGVIFFKEKIKFRTYVSYALAMTGIFILVTEQIDFNSQNALGNISALLSALAYAGYMITSKKARIHMDNFQYALIQYSFTAFCFGLMAFTTNATFSGFDQQSWWAVLGVILFPTFLGHFSFTYLVKHMNLSLMTCGKLIEPVFASIWAYFIFSEHLSTKAIYAFSFTGLAVLNLFWPSIKKSFTHEQKV